MISVVLSTYNHMMYLPMCVDSILNQEYKDFEFIVINDGSTDDTASYLSTLKDDRIKLITHDQNQGIVISYNEGIKTAKGQYLTWVSSDNYYHSDFLIRLIEPLEKNSSKIFVYSAFKWMDESGMLFKTNKEIYMGPHALLLDNPGIASFLYRRSIHDEIGYFNSNIGVASDLDFWVRMVEKYGLDSIIYIPKILCYFTSGRHADSLKRYHTTHDSIQEVVNKARGRRSFEKRILFITPNFVPDWWAGVEVYSFNLAKELMVQGWDVSVLYPKIGPPGIIESEYEGIKKYCLVHDSDMRDMKISIENRSVEDQFIHFLDQHQFDIFHFHHILGFPHSLIRILKRMQYPVCLTLHDAWPLCHKMFLQDEKGNLCSGPSTIDQCVACLIGDKEQTIDQVAYSYYIIALRQANLRNLWGQIDSVVCPSNHLYQTLANCGFGDRVEVSGLGMRERKYQKPDFTFGYFGVIHPVKRVGMLIEAFCSIKRDDIKLSIWGKITEGYVTEFDKILCVAQKEGCKVLYHGSYIHRAYIHRDGFDIDCFINPSGTENFPLTAREALQGKIPVIAADIPAMRELQSKLEKHGIRLFRDQNHLRELMVETVANCRPLCGFKTIRQDAQEWIDRYKKLFSEEGKT